jgi:hypothetical protein
LNEPDALQGEMPGFPFPGRPGGEHDEPLLDMIIARRVLPPDAPQAVHDLERMLAALAGPAESGELASEAAVRAAFRSATSPAGVSPAARRPVRHRRPARSRRPARPRAGLAAVLVAAVAGLGSLLAAYTDLLPSSIQQLAHVAVAAPAPHHHSQPQPPSMPGTARPVVSASRSPSSQPSATPQHSAGPAPASSRPGTRKSLYTPPASSSPGYRPARPICTPGSYRAGVPTSRPTSLPSWAQSQGVHCTGYPTGPGFQPTPDTHIGR